MRLGIISSARIRSTQFINADRANEFSSPMLDLETIERCRLDIEGLGRELLSKPRPRVARELKHVCRLLQKRVIASQKFGNVIDPLGRIADVAARLERESTDDLASYDLKEALQSLTQALIDYRVRS